MKHGRFGQSRTAPSRSTPDPAKILGPDHPDVASSLNTLAGLYQAQGQYAKAEPLLQEALRVDQKALGPEHPTTALSLENLAMLEFDLGRIEAATTLARELSAAQLTMLSKYILIHLRKTTFGILRHLPSL